MTLNDVRAFYRQHYTRAALCIGLAGGFPKEFAPQVRHDFAQLPPGQPVTLALPDPKPDHGLRVQIIQRDTRSSAISLGFPITVTRNHRDWPALALITSYLGQHRSSNSHLYQRLREERGLNYGDYAYIEYFPEGMYRFDPVPNLVRQQEIFQIWIRPVEPQNAHFALRATLYEYDKLLRDGLSAEAFEETRQFLSKYANILTQTQEARLGYAIDSYFYGLPDYNSWLREALAKLTLADVNATLRRHLTRERMQVVVVTKDAEALRQALLADLPSPITYKSPKSVEILAEDKVISAYKLGLKPENVMVVPVEQVFN